MFDVPYPPPAARVETIPPKPRELAVWVDGRWTWEVKHWKWQRGAWVLPPRDAYFSPWQLFRSSDGTLSISPAMWTSADQRQIAAPPLIESADTSKSTTIPEGTE